MKITGVMVIRFERAVHELYGHSTLTPKAVRVGLEAALADVPDIGALESKLRKIQEAALSSGSTMEERIDRIQDVLSGRERR